MSNRGWRAARKQQVRASGSSTHSPHDATFKARLTAVANQHNWLVGESNKALEFLRAAPDDPERGLVVARLTVRLYASHAAAQAWIEAWSIACPACGAIANASQPIPDLPPLDAVLASITPASIAEVMSL